MIGIVTVTYNSADVLPDFLLGIRDAAIETPLRLYIIDNASQDETLDVVESDAGGIDLVTIANATNLGVAEGNNIGIQKALDDGAEWILLLNNDTLIPKGTIAGLVNDAELHRADIVSPAIKAWDPSDSTWYAGGAINRYLGMRATHTGAGQPFSSIVPSFGTTGYASTCCLLVRAEVFSRVGLMDERFFVYYDDVDFAIRAIDAGYHYWMDGGRHIVHKVSALTGGASSDFTIRWSSRNAILITRKHGAGFGRYCSFAYIWASAIAKYLLRRDSFRQMRLRISAFREGHRVSLGGI